MAGSTTNLDLIAASQAQKEVTANALFDAGSPATLYGRRATTTGGLTWGYYGGTIVIGGTPTAVANSTIALTASLVNYIEFNPATGAVTKNTSGWTAGLTRLYAITCDASTITSYVDWRFTGIGAPYPQYPLIFIGTWNASTNSPALTSGVGTKGYLYVVSVAGSTTLDGISSWSVGDQVVFDGTVWRKIEGGITAAEINAALGYTAGDVAGPATSTANAIPRYNGTTGKSLKDSAVIIDDAGNILAPGGVFQLLAARSPQDKSSDFAVSDDDFSFLVNTNSSPGDINVTLPSPTGSGRILVFVNRGSNLVLSAIPEVIPITGGAESSAILPATLGAWAVLQDYAYVGSPSDSAWQIIMAG